MSNKLSLAVAFVAAGLLVPCGAMANDNNMHGSKSGSDQTFMMKAAQGNLAEIKLGQLAEQHASSDKVKDYAKRLVDDHTKALDQLKGIAGPANVTLPTGLSAKDEATYNRLSKLSGAGFDRAYMEHMRTDHRNDIAEYKKEADHGSNADLKQFASSSLPTLNEHLQMANDIWNSSSDFQRTSSRGKK